MISTILSLFFIILLFLFFYWLYEYILTDNRHQEYLGRSQELVKKIKCSQHLNHWILHTPLPNYNNVVLFMRQMILLCTSKISSITCTSLKNQRCFGGGGKYYVQNRDKPKYPRNLGDYCSIGASYSFVLNCRGADLAGGGYFSRFS